MTHTETETQMVVERLKHLSTTYDGIEVVKKKGVVAVEAEFIRDAAALITRQNERIERLTALTAAWAPDGDEPLPEDKEIDACHPLKSKDHAGYMEAMRLVGAKRSKGALVNLVHWLLFRIAALEATK